MKRKLTGFALGLILFSVNANAVYCDGKITAILTGLPYCNSGEHVGFQWEASSKWLCSNSKNMDTMLMAAYAAQTKISVRDSWANCDEPHNGDSPNHIWFGDV